MHHLLFYRGGDLSGSSSFLDRSLGMESYPDQHACPSSYEHGRTVFGRGRGEGLHGTPLIYYAFLHCCTISSLCGSKRLPCKRRRPLVQNTQDRKNYGYIYPRQILQVCLGGVWQRKTRRR